MSQASAGASSFQNTEAPRLSSFSTAAAAAAARCYADAFQFQPKQVARVALTLSSLKTLSPPLRCTSTTLHSVHYDMPAAAAAHLGAGMLCCCYRST